MAFNVSDFRANIIGAGSKSVSKQSHFEVVVSLPRNIRLSTRSRGAYDGLRFRCNAAELPGRAIQTINHKHLGYGLASKMGYDVTYQDMSMAIICSADLGEKSFFQAWQSSIIGNHSRNQDIRRHQSLGYYDDYTCSVGIFQYDETGKVTYSMALAEAFPLTVNALPLSWESQDIHILNISLAYKYFIETDEPAAGRGARTNKAGAQLTINGLPNIDENLEGFGLPRLGEILNIPLFSTESITLTGGSGLSTVL